MVCAFAARLSKLPAFHSFNIVWTCRYILIKERCTERQLPQLLAVHLIKTKLFPSSEQTWHALSRGVFFSTLAKILSEYRCSRNVSKGGGNAKPDLFSLSPQLSMCVYARLYMCVYLCICTCASSNMLLTVFTLVLVARQKSACTQKFV